MMIEEEKNHGAADAAPYIARCNDYDKNELHWYQADGWDARELAHRKKLMQRNVGGWYFRTPVDDLAGWGNL